MLENIEYSNVNLLAQKFRRNFQKNIIYKIKTFCRNLEKILMKT